MSKDTRNPAIAEEHLRSMFQRVCEFSKSLETLLKEVEDDDDENLFIALGDARNVMGVLTNRAAQRLGLS
jgi:uncharacterized protein YuzE